MSKLTITAAIVLLTSLSVYARPVAYTTIPTEDAFSFDLVPGQLNSTGSSEIGLLGYHHWFTTPSPFRWGLGLVASTHGTTSGFFGGSIGGAYSLNFLSYLRLDLSAEVGAAGGGDVKTGGGLFVRPRASLGWRGNGFSVGAGVGGWVFPLAGGMQAVHPFVELRTPNQWTITPGGPGLPDGEIWDPQRWRRDRWRFAAVARKFSTTGKRTQSGGNFGGPSLGLVLLGDHFFSPALFTTVEVVQGVTGFPGFRMLGAGLGISIEIVEDVFIEPVAKFGLSGGGDVPVGQGMYFDAGGRLLVEIFRGATLRGEGGVFRSFNTEAEYAYLGGGIGINLRGRKRKRLIGQTLTEVNGEGVESTFDLDVGLSHWLTTGSTGEDTSIFNARLTYRPYPFVAVFGRLGSGAAGTGAGLGVLDFGAGLVLPVGQFDLSALASLGSAGGGHPNHSGQFGTVAAEVGLHLTEHLGFYGGAGQVFFQGASFSSVAGGLKIRFGVPWEGGSHVRNIRKYDPRIHEPKYRGTRPGIDRPSPPPRPSVKSGK